MSASLVGSEMCIRDSLDGDRTDRTEYLPGSDVTARVPRGQTCFRSSELELRGPRTSPVSYTHLRAHETSAHL
eukprot:10963956-Alexandrium_andersonii.AAC.1